MRACEQCRIRKIRCNKELPCAHCLNTKLDCVYADRKPTEKRTRILLTPQYEKKIDLIEQRLGMTIRLLEELKKDLPAKSSQLAGKDSSATAVSTPSSNAAHPEAPGLVVEGDSSFSAHSAFAKEFLHKVVDASGSLRHPGPEMQATLDSLHLVVNTLKHQSASAEMTYPHAKQMQRSPMSKFDMPPIQKTVFITRLPKSECPPDLICLVAMLPAINFSDICLNVYFSPQHTETDFIIVNSFLYFLFSWYACHLSEEERKEYEGYAEMCRANLETALHNLPLHLPATSDTIIALICGAIYAIEISKPSLSWTLTNKASEICQTLGYHRIASMKNDAPKEKEKKQFLFWLVYCIDKSLSLRLGRSSAIQDWDISIPFPEMNTSTSSAASQSGESNEDTNILMAWVFQYWVVGGHYQGSIYETLYSSDAISQPDHVRQSRVETLARQLDEYRQKSWKFYESVGEEDRALLGADFFEFLHISDDVLCLSLLTLVYRAAPPRPSTSSSIFSIDCIQAARLTLERHQDCMKIIKKTNFIWFPTYVRWTLLFGPFIPFIVLFCHAIENITTSYHNRTRNSGNPDSSSYNTDNDLERLHCFITSISSAPSVSEAAAKMYRLLDVLYNIAQRYIGLCQHYPHGSHTESNTSDPIQPQLQGASFDMNAYLAALGFPSAFTPSATVTDTQQQQPITTAMEMETNAEVSDFPILNEPTLWLGGTAAQIDDWFYSNQSQMLSLLRDTSGIDSIAVTSSASTRDSTLGSSSSHS